MKALMIKSAGMENSGMDDPRTGLPIYISTTTRMKYRELYSQERAEKYTGRESYKSLRNSQMNSIIAQDFAASYQNALHMFPSNSSDVGSRRRNWIELRKFNRSGMGTFNIFVSIITPNYIGVIKVTSGWKPVPEDKRRMFVPRG
jgi:hypothetical protein